jgi:hypothetical protein
MNVGVMDKQMIKTTRSTIEWVSGVNTIKLTNITIAKKVPVTGYGNTATLSQQYSLLIGGVLGEPGGFLRLEMCPKNSTTLEPILGQGLCKEFVETTDACCEKDRHFSIQLAAECHSGDDELSNVEVDYVYMDNITIAPVAKIRGATILVANRDVTDTMLTKMKEDVAWAVKDFSILKVGGKNLTVLSLLNRILHFNAPHENFHCR